MLLVKDIFWYPKFISVGTLECKSQARLARYLWFRQYHISSFKFHNWGHTNGLIGFPVIRKVDRSSGPLMIFYLYLVECESHLLGGLWFKKINLWRFLICTQYSMRNSTFVYMVKTESLYKVTICDLKMMVKSGLILWLVENKVDRSYTKGQLISKGLFKVFICTKKWMRIFLYFCPSL